MANNQHYLWYVPIALVMIIGYGVGGALTFELHFLGWLPSISNSSARLVLELFGMGMLGSTMYCTKWWAKDIDEAICKPQFLPHAFDCFGYATTVIGGGITGTVLYLAINSGALLTITVTNSGEPRVSFAFFVAFVVDYFTLK